MTDTRTKMKLGILISGRGSNMQALIEACGGPDFPAEIVCVLSNRPEAQGLVRAREAGLPTELIDHKAYDGREAFEDALHGALQAAKVDMICLAGFMRVLTPGFIDRWPGKILNIHPSLLPSFQGLHIHERTLEAGVHWSGCTVHFVTSELDGGPILGQAAVPVRYGDTPDSLAARILEQEHKLYPAVVKLLAQGRITLGPDGVTCADAAAWQAVTLG